MSAKTVSFFWRLPFDEIKMHYIYLLHKLNTAIHSFIVSFQFEDFWKFSFFSLFEDLKVKILLPFMKLTGLNGQTRRKTTYFFYHPLQSGENMKYERKKITPMNTGQKNGSSFMIYNTLFILQDSPPRFRTITISIPLVYKWWLQCHFYS